MIPSRRVDLTREPWDNPLDMGLKRWLLALFILAVVVGLLALIFMQSGADEAIVTGVLPEIEKRLKVEITYKDIEVSLTSVALCGVEVRPAGRKNPFFTVEKMGVGVSVGPLLVGDIDLTGVRLDGLDLRVGEGVGGAGGEDWRELLERVEKSPPSVAGADVSPERRIPEVRLESGRAEIDDGRFRAVVSGLSGTWSSEAGAVIGVEGFTLSRGESRLAVGERGEIVLGPGQKRVSCSLERPEFELFASRDDIIALVRDVHASLAGLGLAGGRISVGRDADAASRAVSGERETKGISLRVAVAEASGALVDPERPDRRLAVDDVSVELSAGRDLAVRASGGLPATDARWGLDARWPEDGNPTLEMEVPDISLGSVGEMLWSSEHVRWEGSSADGSAAFEVKRGGEEISARGQVAISGLSVEHERLAEVELSDLDFHADFKLSLDRKGSLLSLERLQLSRGHARAVLRGDVRLDRLAFDLRLNVPPTACRQLVGALPEPLRERVTGVQAEGLLALNLHLAIDEDDPGETALEASVDNRCRITDYGPLPSPDHFRRPFRYTAYTADGEPLSLTSGPGTDRWTPLSAISPYVIEAVLTTEDGKFRRHRGVTIPEVRRAIELNLRQGELSHGASTITMQLAKNLFLTRERTVARKLQELMLTWYLESGFTKEELLELYLNVIEFGPLIYGIREAADHYFGRLPRELNLMESVFLIKLLPSPVSRHGAYVRDDISQRKMNVLHRVMRTMHQRGRITEEELSRGLEQELVFHREGDPRPPPRELHPGQGSGLMMAAPQVEEHGESLAPLPSENW